MDLLKLLKKHPKDAQALRDASLNLSAKRRGDKTYQAMTWTEVEGKQVTWSSVHGYESPRRAVLHAIRAGVEARMKAAALFNQEKANATE